MHIKFCTDHLGNRFNSISDMLRYYNISKATYYGRLRKNKGLKYALTGEDDNWVFDHEGNRFNSITSMCDYWNISVNAYYYRINSGWSLKDTLTVPLNFVHIYKDHLGNVFNTKLIMCEHWGIKTDTFDKRINSGWSLKDALTVPVSSPSCCKDHLGNVFNTKTEMCEHWGISLGTLEYRMSLGWSIKDALTKDVAKQVRLNDLECVDHLGNRYSSVKEMCDKYGISVDIYRQRLKSGMALEEIFKDVKTSWSDATDHLGNKFANIPEMCKYWNISVAAYCSRIRKGWSIKLALTTPVKKCSKIYEVKDHLGNTYQSKSVMAEQWGISYVALRQRLKQGWTLEKALTTPECARVPRSRVVTDHLGNEFKSNAEMCRYWGISLSAFSYRIKHGMSLELTLTLSDNVSTDKNTKK